jgi:hypothetical protein
MHGTYPKIQGLFKRDEKGKFIDGDYSLDAFRTLRFVPWIWVEKYDGTNIRVGIDTLGRIEIRGKTDRADLPQDLIDHIKDLEPMKVFEGAGASLDNVTLYGEGYGGKIQKGSATYGPDKKFVAFDLRIGDYWVPREDLRGICNSAGIPFAETLLVGDIYDAVHGVQSLVVDHGQGEFVPEGVVGQPQGGPFYLHPNPEARVMTKVKAKDIKRMEEELS